MANDLNDVVRHVILRVLVDADTLGAELAKARAQLKGLEDSEKDANKRREKAFEGVTKAAKGYTQALKENQSVAERTGSSVEKSAKAAADSHKESTTAVNQETKALVEQGKEADRQASAEQKRKQDLLDAQQKRRAKTKEDDDKSAKRQQELTSQAIADEISLEALRAKHAGDEVARQKIAESTIRESERNERAARTNKNRESKADAEQTLAGARKLAEQASAIESKATDARRKADADRKNARLDQSQNSARRDFTTTSGEVRKDTDAAARRLREALKTNVAIENSSAQSQQRISERASKAEEVLDHLKTENRRKQTTAQQTDDEKLAKLRVQNAANELVVQKTLFDTIDTILETNASKRDTADANTGTAQSRRNVAVNRELADLETIRDVKADRRAKSTFTQLGNAEKLKQLAQQTALVEQRAAEVNERRIRSDETAARRKSGATSGFRGLLDNTRGVLRAVGDADPDTRTSRRRNGTEAFDREFAESGNLTRGVAAFFGSFKKGEGEATRVLDRFRSRYRGFKREFESESSGGGGRGGKFFQNFGDIGDALFKKIGPLARTMLSFRGVIIAVLAAFGPLAAILGAVGAAALGLASNFVALSGSLLALPGLIGAAVAGFGALALIMKPLSGVFSAYSAAQKAATSATADGGKAARDAANEYKDALFALETAQIRYKRAQEDAPRAAQKLADAYKAAGREIQDYRLALQKLEYDQTNASLGVESAEQNYRRALADPTQNNLARKVARNDVVGALFDERDQKVASGRLIEDAAEAERKGVEGSDAVIDAKRAQLDATRDLVDAERNLAKARRDATEAGKDKAAGGKASRAAKEELEAQLDALGPITQKVIRPLLDLGDKFKALRIRISEAFFKPLSNDTGKFGDILTNLEAFLTPAATAMGELAEKALKLFTNADWKKFFSEQGTASGNILRDLGDAALSFASGLKNVTEIARPFTKFVTGGIKGMAKSFEDFTNSDKGRKSIGDFLEITKKRFQELKPVLKAFFDGLVGFFKALNGYGDEDFTGKINTGLLDIANKFKALGEEAANPNSGFRKWLKEVGPLIKDVAKFIGDAGRFFGTLFSDKSNITEAQAILKNLGEKVLPALADVFDQLSESGAISKLAAGIGGALSGISRFLDNGGTTALSVFFSILEAVGTTIDTLSKNIPILTGALGFLATALGVIGGLAIFGKILQIDKIIKLIQFLRGAANPGGGRAGGITGVFDNLRDRATGRDAGETNARREAAREGAPKDVNRTNTGGVLPTLYRIEEHILTIIRLMGGGSGRNRSRGNPDGTGPAGAGGTDTDGRNRRNPSGGPTGGGGSTGGGGPGADDDETRRRSNAGDDGTGPATERQRRGSRSERRPVRRYRIPAALLAEQAADRAAESADIEQLITERRNPRSAENPRRARTTTAINDPSPISGGPFDPVPTAPATTRGNNRFRSDRLRNDPAYNAAEDAAYAQQRSMDDEADVLTRRGQATEERNNRPTAGRLTRAQRRRQAENARYARSTTPATPTAPAAPPNRFSQPSLFNTGTSYGDLGQFNPDRPAESNPRRARSTTPGEPGRSVQPSLFNTGTSYGDLGQFNNARPVEANPRRTRSLTPGEPGRSVQPSLFNTGTSFGNLGQYGQPETPQGPRVPIGRPRPLDSGGGFEVTGRRTRSFGEIFRPESSDRSSGFEVSGRRTRSLREMLPESSDRSSGFEVAGRRTRSFGQIFDGMFPSRAQYGDDTSATMDRPARSFRDKRQYTAPAGLLTDADLSPTPARTIRPKRQYGQPRSGEVSGGSFLNSVFGPEDDQPGRTVRPKRRYSVPADLLPDVASAVSDVDVQDDTPRRSRVQGRTVRPKRQYGVRRRGETAGGAFLDDMFGGGDDAGYATLPTNGRFLGIPLPGQIARDQRDESRRARSTRGPGRFRTAFDQTLAGMNPDADDFVSLREDAGRRTRTRTTTEDSDTPTRRGRRRRPSGPGRRRRRGRGSRRNRSTAAGTGAAGGGEDEYDEGYDDGLKAAGGAAGAAAGGGDSPADTASSLVDDLLGELDSDDDSDDDDDNDRRRRSTEGEDDDGNGRHRRADGEDDDDNGRRRRTSGEPEESRPQTRSERRRQARGSRRGGRGTRRAPGLARRLSSRASAIGAGRFGGLARGLAGGVGGVAASLALSYGGDAAIDKFVKNDDDANSLSRGLGAVSTGAGIGATIGSIVPGVGTVVGGAVGGVIGGAYSLVKDKNLRNFVGGKISSGARAVGGALSRAGSAVSSVFTGEDSDGNKVSTGDRVKNAAGALLGPVALLAKTDIGKNIVDSLQRAGGAIGDFFTKTIPNFFSQGVVRPIQNFFTKTLPSLPGRAFDAITTGLGVAFGFLTKTAPRLVGEFFTEVLPKAAADGWTFVRQNLFEPIGKFIVEDIPRFFTDTIPGWFSSAVDWFQTSVIDNVTKFVTEDIPRFFTETIPKWFAEAPEFFQTKIIDPVTDFFTVDLPNFFTVTLPNAITSLPGTIYNNLIQPVLDFFGGISAHIGDFLRGSFDWARNLFSRGSKNFEAGAASQSMSGGLVKGVYRGIEDTQPYWLTSEEFVVRRGAVVQPGGKEFLRDFNEGRVTPADYYAGLSAATTPRVMSIVPPSAPSIRTGVTNTTVDNASRHDGLSVGDITINNPVREPSDRSMRRALQIAATRHRR